MLKLEFRIAIAVAATLGAAALNACNAPQPDAPPPPPQAYSSPVETTELAGGPGPATDDTPRGYDAGPAGGGRQAGFTQMAPIPDPEDLPPAERERIYGGTKYAHGPERGGEHLRGVRQARREAWRQTHAHARTVEGLAGGRSHRRHRRHAAVQPPYAPPAVRPATRPHALAPSPVAPKAAAPPPKPVVIKPPVVAVAPATPPVVPTAPIPAARLAVAPSPPLAAPAAPLATALPAAPHDPKVAKLQAVMEPLVTRSAALTVADSIAQGQSGTVTLTLSHDLFTALRAEAAKAGLTASARNTDIVALLSGSGYTITPNGVQTMRLANGEVAKFDWLVTPETGDKGPLKADVDAVLRGAGKPKSFSLATLSQTVRPIAIDDRTQPRSAFGLPDALNLPGTPTVDLPGVGPVPSKNVVAALIAGLILLLLVAIVRRNNASRERGVQRRKARDSGPTPYGLNVMHLGDDPPVPPPPAADAPRREHEHV
jgi:hypothetical protein